MSDLGQLDDATQEDLLRVAAVSAAPAFGIDVEDITLVAHAFNTTFCVEEPSGRQWAVRVNTNSVSTPAMVAAQADWMIAITQSPLVTEAIVPAPLAALDGRWFTEVEIPQVMRTFTVVANSWLDGRDVGRADEAVAERLGRAMAQLHTQAAAWGPDKASALRALTRPFSGDGARLRAAVSDAQRAVVEAAFARTAEEFAGLHDAPVHAIHADLHGGNLKWHDGRLAIFDFDDCGVGHDVVDLGIAAFYLRNPAGTEESALLRGYAQVRDLPDLGSTYESVLASRQLLLMESLLASTTGQFQAMIPDYLPIAVRRLQQWLDTGRFSFEV